MANYNNGKKKFNDNKGFPRKSKEEYEAEKAARIARQNKNLDMIEDVAAFLDDKIKNKGEETTRISMRDILDHLNNDKGYAAEDTKVISQFNYLMLDLANSRMNTRISGDRLNIRVMYIEERLKTSYKSELHDRILGIIDTYNTLFFWDNESDGKDYNTLGE